MKKLLLENLEIKNFRCYQHLKLEKLGRVNLFVGKNSVGKSSILESLRLYSERGSLLSIVSILENRREVSTRRLSSSSESDEDTTLLSVIEYLFYGRKSIAEKSEPFLEIGPLSIPEKTLKLQVKWLPIDPRRDDRRVVGRQLSLFGDNIPTLEINLGEQSLGISPLDRDFYTYNRTLAERVEPNPVPNFYISTSGLSDSQIRRLWDKTVLTEAEEQITNGLRIIIPDVDRIAVVDLGASNRSVKVKLQRIAKPVPLRSLGDGMSRIFEIMLALVNSKDGFFLVDEIENGLHYTVQEQLWKLIFEIAPRLNIQVFATTHSWDCIEAFQRAAVANGKEEGTVIRLEKEAETIIPTLFDEKLLTIVTREQIEVR